MTYDGETYEDLENSVVEWIKSLSNSQVILADQNGPAPAESYFTVKLVSPEISNGSLSDEDIYIGGRRKLVGPRECSVSLDAWGPSCSSEIFKVKNALLLQASLDKLAELGLALVSRSDVRNLDGERDTEIDPHRQMDIRLRYTIELDNGVDTIEKVELVNEDTGDAAIVP